MNKEYGDPRFYALLDELAELHSKKNHDYAGEDPLSNFKISEKFGIPAWKGALVRLSDKVSRVWEFAKKEKFEVSDETFKDTLMDLAVYALITIILYEDTALTNKMWDTTSIPIRMQKFYEGGGYAIKKGKES